MRNETLESSERVRFEFQKWPVYREAIALTKDCLTISQGLRKAGQRSLLDQLRRASQSVPLNIAEGSARYTKADKINFFRVARGSVFECVAIVDLAQVVVTEPIDSAAVLSRLESVGKMLSGLIRFIENEKPSERRTPLNP